VSATTIEAGRTAIDRRDWPAAYEALAAADGEGALTPEDLELLAKAAWWTGRQDRSIAAHERAYAAYVERDDRHAAAFMALTLRREHSAKLERSVAQGWLTRAEALLKDDDGEEDRAHGYLALAHGSLAWGRGELEHARDHFARGEEIGVRVGDADLRAWAATYRGMVLIDLGQVDEGWVLMEDVSAAAVGGELGGYTTGGIFCNVITTCRALADYGRATEWADAATRWCERQAITGFPGVCRVHRAEVMRLVGAWAEADRELRVACDELFEFSPVHAGEAFHELGEVRLRMGNREGAEAAFRRATELGVEPEPGRALMLLRDGKLDAAAAAIDRGLDDVDWSRLDRARLLPTKAEIALRRRDAAAADAAATELDAISDAYPSQAIAAGASWAHGCLALVAGDPAEASRRFRKARQLWRSIDAPYESARAATLLAEALASDGDVDGAVMELDAARAAFARLGAEPDVRVIDERLVSDTAPSSPATVQRTLVFTDIVGSTALLEAIGDDAWSDLRRWHDETLRRCIAGHGGEEVDHAGDGFFVVFPDAAAAASCAIEIQRQLAEHRRGHGFAPQVRIGIHAADATKDGTDYSGLGVHTAARIGALAGGGEIVTSAATASEMGAVTLVEPRTVELKGIAEPIEVVSIEWR
jgi:class 3 adenylate cyclase